MRISTFNDSDHTNYNRIFVITVEKLNISRIFELKLSGGCERKTKTFFITTDE